MGQCSNAKAGSQEKDTMCLEVKPLQPPRDNTPGLPRAQSTLSGFHSPLPPRPQMSADFNRQFLDREGSHQRQEGAGLRGNAGLAEHLRTALGLTVSTLLSPAPAAGAEGIGVSGEEV